MTKILLVEDSKFLRLATERALARVGYEMSSAADGEEALRVAREKLPDLILLDMLLPKMSGLDVLKAEGRRFDPGDSGRGNHGHVAEKCSPARARWSLRLPGKIRAGVGQGIGKIIDGGGGDSQETLRRRTNGQRDAIVGRGISLKDLGSTAKSNVAT